MPLLNASTGTPRNDFDGWVGGIFTPAVDKTVTYLGVQKLNGNTGTADVALLPVASNTVLARGLVDFTGIADNDFAYIAVYPASCPNTSGYTVQTYVTNGGRMWTGDGTATTADANITLNNAAVRAGAGVIPSGFCDFPGAHWFAGATALFAGDVPPGTSLISSDNATLQSGLSLLNWSKQSGYVATGSEGASLDLALTGATSVWLRVDMTPNRVLGVADSRLPMLKWSVDGVDQTPVQLTPGIAEIRLASASCSSIKLYVRGLSPFEHRYHTGTPPPNVVKLLGIRVNTGAALASPTLPANTLLVIGDSISVGNGALGAPADDTWAQVDDARKAYPYLLADHFGWRISNLGYGGYNWGGVNVAGTEYFPKLSTLIDNVFEGVSRISGGKFIEQPNLVLINLGENGAPLSADMVDALTILRSRLNAGVKVIVMIPVAGTARAGVTSGFNDYQTASPDADTVLYDIGWSGTGNYATGDGQHPLAAGHVSIYDAIVDDLAPYFESEDTTAPTVTSASVASDAITCTITVTDGPLDPFSIPDESKFLFNGTPCGGGDVSVLDDTTIIAICPFTVTHGQSVTLQVLAGNGIVDTPGDNELVAGSTDVDVSAVLAVARVTRVVWEDDTTALWHFNVPPDTAGIQAGAKINGVAGTDAALAGGNAIRVTYAGPIAPGDTWASVAATLAAVFSGYAVNNQTGVVREAGGGGGGPRRIGIRLGLGI